MRSRRRTWLVIAAASYVIGALVVGLWPAPVDSGFRRQIAQALGLLRNDGLPATYGALEFTANVVFFAPIGILLCLLLAPRLWFLAVLGGALLSGAIELSQLLLLPARFASWNDILANTTGTVIGVVLVLIGRGIQATVRTQVSTQEPRLR